MTHYHFPPPSSFCTYCNYMSWASATCSAQTWCCTSPKESAPHLKSCVHFGAPQCKEDKLSEHVQRWVTKMVKCFKGKPYKWLRSLCFFSLEKWRLRGTLITADNFFMGGSAQGRCWSLFWWAAIGYEEMEWNHVRGSSDWTLGKCSSLRGWLVTGTSFTGK